MNRTDYMYIAIDIAKTTLQVQWPDRSECLANEPSALEAWAHKVSELSGALVVFEASGGYERPLLQRLWKHNVPCCMVEPRRIKGFAQSEGIKAKTDPIDARLILRFAQEKALQPQRPKDEQNQVLSELMDRRGHLSEQLTREKNRLQKCSASTENLIKRMICFVEEQLAEIDQSIEKLIESDATLSLYCNQLKSVCGVGPATAWTILAYLREIDQLGRNQLVALAGLAPFNRDSGKKEGRRSIHAGRGKVRRCLYMAARSAAVHNPHIKAYVTRLRENGKPYKVALVAAMRKMLIHMQSIIKNTTKYA